MRVPLNSDYNISKVIKGGWQLSGGHTLTGQARSEDDLIRDMEIFHEAGITTLDFGDIYTGVEELVGKFLLKGKKAEMHTKYVPDRSSLAKHKPEDVRKIVDRSRQRLGVEQVDLVQFHWWDYEQPAYLEALHTLFQLKDEGAIREVGVTNFDTAHLREFVEAGLKPLTAQIQYSLLDRRPEAQVQSFCQAEGINLLCYGTVAGGFLSERFLGLPEPSKDETRSQTKYRLIIEEFGGWALFQDLLKVLKSTATKHQTDIASIASAWVLAQPGVTAVIVGARDTSHLQENAGIADLTLDEEDQSAIQKVLGGSTPPRGDVYDFERNDPKHSGIMRMNLNDH